MKNKFTKIIIYIILLIIVFMVSFNYILFKNFNLNNILNVNKGNYTQYNISYDKLIKNESIKFSEPNILNIVSCDYKVNVNNLNLKIKDFSIETNDNNINYKIVLYTKNGKKIVKYSNDFIKISKKTKSVYVNDEIKKIKIDAQYEIYDRKYSPSKNAKIIRVGKININSQKNRNLINKISLIKSLFVTIIFILIMLILKFISKIKDNKLNNINIYKSFLFFSIFFGIIFSILMPLYQTPDELTHINMIYQELNYKNIDLSDNFRNYADMSNVVRNVKRKVNVDKYFDLSKRINIKPQLHIPKISIIRHLPQAIGLIISMILNLPIFITITLCETLAVLLYSFVCYKALKLMPFKKYVLAFIMLLPISIQQFSSFSYDATLNCFCFIFIAYILHIKYVKEQFDIMDFLKLIGIALIIAVTKIPYVLLFLLILLIPLKKYNFNLKFIIIDYQYLKKHKKSIIIILCIFLPILLYFVYKVLTKIIIGKILLCTIRHPIISYKLIRQTTNIFFGNYILTLIGKLSWFDVILDN